MCLLCLCAFYSTGLCASLLTQDFKDAVCTPVCIYATVCMCVYIYINKYMYHGQVFKDLDPVSWSHVGYMVEVGGVGDQLVPHLWISQHLSGITNTKYKRQLRHGKVQSNKETGKKTQKNRGCRRS